MRAEERKPPGNRETESRVFDAGLARAAVALILDGQAPPFEGRVRARIDEARWFDSTDDLAGAGMDYFGPVARKARRPLAGFSKRDVADTTNVVWLDLDPPPDAAADDGALLVAEAERWLDALRALGLPPSVFVFSGRGAWAYWKLDRHISQPEAESLMRSLYAQFRAEGSEHDIGRVARMPGSTNEKTGLRAFVMALDENRRDPDDLRRLLPEADEPSADGTAHDRVDYDRALKPGGKLPALELPEDLAEYVASKPSKRDRAAQDIDGSSREQAIVSRLVNAGCSDPQIALFFDRHRLPRHEEEKRRRRGYAWLAMSIANARARMTPSPPPVSIGKGTYFDEAGGERYGPRETGWSARRWVILRDMPEGLRKLDLLEWAKERFSIERSQARRELDWLEKEKGYIGALPDGRDRRVKRICRTEAGRRRLESWTKVGTPFEFLKGLPSPPGDAPAEPEQAQELVPEPEPAPLPGETTPVRTSISEEVAADRAERRRRERSLINDVYRIHIPGICWTYLQLLLPLDEWAKVRLHEQLRVGVDGGGLPVHRTFISTKDLALRGPAAHDPIEERTVRDGGFEASDRRIGVAAELISSGTGFELATRVERRQTLPNVGLLVQSDKNFYRPLRAYRQHQDKVIAARKRGKGLETTYEFMIAGDAIEIPAGLAPDLGALLDHLADEAEMRAVLDSLPDGWRLVKRPPW
jgi:DNA-binding MarR family transcriptional regulator